MIPVPQALETVLTETAKSLWFRRQHNDANTSVCSSHQQLLGRISAMDVKAPSPGYPNHNSSIMDGYAVKTSELANAREDYNKMNQEQKGKFTLDFIIAGKVYAGDDNLSDNANHFTAVYVTTGAVVPADYDAVIPIEETGINQQNDGTNKMCIISSKIESVLNSTTPWTWIRTIGLDIPPGTIVLSEGEKILPVHVALLAQVGISLDGVPLKRLPRVGVLSTGNELLASASELSPGTQQPHGKIPDVNRPLLLSQLTTYDNCVPIDLGIASDDDGCENIAHMLEKILWNAEDDEGIDVLITTGGISMGEKDIMEQVFVGGMGGKVHFGRMNMKPGKPTTFITIDRDGTKKLIFALPGNPVSASVCTELLVRPCLDLLHDSVDSETLSPKEEDLFVKRSVNNARVHDEVMATITSDIKLDQGRPEYRRVALQRLPSNDDPHQYTYHATGTGVQRSSRVLSLRGADGLMILPRGGTSGCGYDIAEKGAKFPVLVYSSLSSSSKTCFKDSMHRALWKSNHHHQHNARPGSKLSLGAILCISNERRDEEEFQSIDATLVKSLGGNSSATLVHREICRVPPDANDDTFVQQLSSIVNGPQMEGVNVIFVVVPTNANLIAEDQGSSAIAFRAGLEVSHALRHILIKNANAMALQVRKYAASRDPMAALFENIVGTVRDGSSVLITCSDKGLEGAVGAVKGLLGHLVSFFLI
ncbi:hypothetical protein ACHAXR_004335 [Thalassiosira sp. AJA248-18]